MPHRWIAVVLVLGVALLGFIAWNGSRTPAQQEAPTSSGDAAAPGAEAAMDPGIEWEVPRDWSTLEASPMRLATYQTPAAGGAEAAECRVHYFGPGQGGSIEDNLERWIGEFETSGAPEKSSRKVNGLTVARVRVKGTYASHGGGMEGEAKGQSNQELLGAIVETQNGPVFFKLVGPVATVDAQVGAFDKMIGSVRNK